MSPYQIWLTKIRKRARPSGALSQWAEVLAQEQNGDAEMWREHLRDILDEKERATPDLILDLDLITAPAKSNETGDQQMPLW